MQEVYDRQLHNYLHKLIEKRCSVAEKIQLTTLRLCGRQVVKSENGKAGVFLLSNGSDSKLFGATMCKNPFACPCCSAHRMAIYSAQIGLALDEMEKRGYIGFMMTFTVPHLGWMTCRDVTDILFETYSYYRRTAKQKNYRKTNRTGTISGQFYKDCGIEHSVMVCEYTHGKNGWHPHFHGIFWTKKNNKDKILKWESALNEFWIKTALRIAKKHYPESNVLNKLFETAEEDAGIYISKKDGKISISKSSEYLCGWGANREVTGNYRKKASDSNHRTPYQILEDAYNGDKYSADLYIDFCLAVTRKPVHHRVIWSRTGIKAVVIQAEQVHRATEYLKKKETEKWRVIVWFTCEDWYKIIDNDGTPHIANLLYLGRAAPHLVIDYLEGTNLDYQLPETHYLTKCVEGIFNMDAYKQSS